MTGPLQWMPDGSLVPALKSVVSTAQCLHCHAVVLDGDPSCTKCGRLCFSTALSAEAIDRAEQDSRRVMYQPMPSLHAAEIITETFSACPLCREDAR